MGQALPRLFSIWLLILWAAAPGCGNSNPEPCTAGAAVEDLDCDGVLRLDDNCPETFNPNQTDSDDDGLGDVCEPVPCGDGICNPEGGECDVFEYCAADCSQSLCFGLDEGETCGDGICQPLAGECANSGPCLKDCPNEFFCYPGTCGDRLCQPWEDDPDETVTFCFIDCICRIEKPVTDECRGNADCLDQPGTVCGPEEFPEPPPGEDVPDFRQIACACTTCGNTVLDPGEGCDISAGVSGVEACFSQGGLCEEFSCECLLQEFDCGDTFDNDGDGMTDCEDPDCLGMPGC